MKKVFTSFCLAIMAFLLTTPAIAQQRELTNQEKAAVVQKMVPVMLEQVSNISGINLLPGEGEITLENLIPIIGPIIHVDADLNTISFKPDSMTVDITKLGIEGLDPTMAQMLKNIFITFDDYVTFPTPIGGQMVNLSIPQKVVGHLRTLGMNDAATLTIAIGEKKGFLPFSSLNVDLKFSQPVEAILANVLEGRIKSGKLLTFTEKVNSATAFDYSLVLEEGLRNMMKPENEQMLPDFLVKLSIADLQTKGLIQASAYGVIGATTQVNMGDATVQMDQNMQAQMIELTSYETGTVKGYRKMTFSTEQKNENQYVTTMADSIRVTKEDAWEWQSNQITTTTNMAQTKSASLPAILSRAVDATISAQPLNAKITVETVMGSPLADPIKTMETVISSAMGGTPQEPALVTTIKLSSLDEETMLFEEDMHIEVNLPVNSKVVSIAFKPIIEGKPELAATLYTESDIMSGGVANESINTNNISIRTYEGGIQVVNCEKATYSIVSMQGSTVAQGRINSTDTFISTANVSRGGIYILVINENGTQKTFKFVNK